MAKVANPYGLRPIRRVDGLPYAGQMRQIKIASGYNTNIAYGDIVTLNASGTLIRAAGTASLTNGAVGVFQGVQLFSGGPLPVAIPFGEMWTENTVEPDARGYVVDDPFAAFLIQANGSLDQDALGKNFAIINPTPTGRFSGVALNAGSAGTADTLPFKVVDFFTGDGARMGDAYTDVIVMFNPKSHLYLRGTGVS